MAKNINQSEFNSEVLESSKISLVDFWATWCQPCKMLGPVLEELSKEMTDINFFKINTDENQDLTVKYQVASIPTMILFKDGEIIGKIGGFLPKDALKAEINKIIK